MTVFGQLKGWALPAIILVAGAAFAEAPGKLRQGAGQFKLSLSNDQREQLTDQKRDDVIEQLQRISAKFDDDSPQKPDLLFQLSEYYWEKSKFLFRSEEAHYDSDFKSYEKARDRGASTPAPTQSHVQSERYRALTMQIYEKLLKGYKAYERRDEVIFAMAFNLYEIGQNSEAIKRYDELIRRYPKSKFVPDAYIQLGNHYFDHNDLPRATVNYEKALATRIPKIYSYALYKLAWCDYNIGAFDKARKKLEEVVDFADNHGKGMVDLRNEALSDLVVVFVRLDRPDEAITYFKRKAQGTRQHRLIAKMANELGDAGHHDNAIRVFRYLLADNPDSPDAPDWQKSVVRAYDGLRQRSQVKQEVKRLAELYRPGSAWWKANAGNPGVLRNGFDVSEEAMRNIVTEYHQEAQKTRQVETYRLARDIYREYLDSYASSADEKLVSDYAFNMSFYYAEILWTLEDWSAAARAYDTVVAFKLPARDTAREVANQSYRKTAAYDAILAYDRLVKIDAGKLSNSLLRDGQKVDENRGKGKVDEGTKLVRKDASVTVEQPLTANEERLILACDRYTQQFSSPKDETDIRYQAALILYNKSHFVGAAKRFEEIILKWPEEKRSQEAADLTMAVLESQRAWPQLNAVAQKFAANKRLTRPGTEFAARVANVVEGSRYRYVDEVVYKQDKKPLEAAEAFLKFADDFPHTEHGDQALTLAMIIYSEQNQLDRGIAAGERALKEYPHSLLNLKVRYTLARLYERTADFRKSAQMYEFFIAAFDAANGSHSDSRGKTSRTHAAAQKPRTSQAGAHQEEAQKLVQEASAWVPDAQFNAALWWEGLNRTEHAVAAYKLYLGRFGDRPDSPEVAFNIGRLYEKEGQHKEAAHAFESFGHEYARDARVSGARRYLAVYHQLRAELQLHNSREAEKLQDELTRGHARLSPKDREDADVLNAYGHARFLDREALWKSYLAIRFNRVATLRADLMAKQKKLKEVEKAYLEVLSTGAGEYGIAALTRIGGAYADLAQNIRTSPDPKGLNEDQRQLYRGELENLAMPLEDKSVEALEKGLGKAYELNIYNRWTLEAQEQVNRFRPGQYEKVRPVEYQGSEFFATAPLDAELWNRPAVNTLKDATSALESTP